MGKTRVNIIDNSPREVLRSYLMVETKVITASLMVFGGGVKMAEE